MDVDGGAHFYRCDLQVHTPRDAQWKGAGADSKAEREAYAVEFVTACRERGINAVAITDHHDMAFVPFITAAAAAELDSAGNQVPQHARLVVFPGMELTLGIPCQALLLFDATLPPDMFPLVRAALAINQSDDAAARGIQAERLERITTLEQLHDELDRHQYLRRRYIIFPNVSDSGASTLLRSGHAGHYKDMPCVGGYLDHPVGKMGQGNRDILSGKDPNYGKKPLALFQTSDNRSRDFADLGKLTTWVKWATPTAEALRQACLARESRISQRPPELPTVFISSIGVSNSRFLGPLVLNFNRQYNAIIGGRGTGKSTILEYLRWALCDEPPPPFDDEVEPGDYQAKRRRLIDKTLVTVAGNVQVIFSVNAVPHVVRRHADTDVLQLKIGDGAFEPCSEAEIRKLLPIQAYSQRQLSGVGVRVEELRRFIRSPLQKHLELIDHQFASVSSQLRAEFGRLDRHRLAALAVANDTRETRSLSDQLKVLRASLGGIDEADKATVDLHASYENANYIVDRWRQELERAELAVENLNDAITDVPTELGDLTSSLPNAATLIAAHRAFAALFQGLRERTAELASELERANSAEGRIREQLAHWERERSEFDSRYEAAKSRSNLHETVLKQLSNLEERSRALREGMATHQAELTATQDAASNYGGLHSRWRALHVARADSLRKQCDRLTELSGGLIRAQLKAASEIKSHVDELRGLVSAARIKAAKFDKLVETIAADGDALAVWLAVLEELHALVHAHAEGSSNTPPPCPMLARIGFSESDLARVAQRLTGGLLLDLGLRPVDDRLVFEYRAREGEYIPFADASAGQQATALLGSLLNQDGPPLIVDQPEDDLDNQVMLTVVEQIVRAKRRRQLIFCSHNANLVVNGDAELVVCCGNRVAGEQSSGQVMCQGAIDVDNVRSEIATVMEGGSEAFKLRLAKYGF